MCIIVHIPMCRNKAQDAAPRLRLLLKLCNARTQPGYVDPEDDAVLDAISLLGGTKIGKSKAIVPQLSVARTNGTTVQ